MAHEKEAGRGKWKKEEKPMMYDAQSGNSRSLFFEKRLSYSARTGSGPSSGALASLTHLSHR